MCQGGNGAAVLAVGARVRAKGQAATGWEVRRRCRPGAGGAGSLGLAAAWLARRARRPGGAAMLGSLGSPPCRLGRVEDDDHEGDGTDGDGLK